MFYDHLKDNFLFQATLNCLPQLLSELTITKILSSDKDLSPSYQQDSVCRKVENIMRKGVTIGNMHFSFLLPQRFQNNLLQGSLYTGTV